MPSSGNNNDRNSSRRPYASAAGVANIGSLIPPNSEFARRVIGSSSGLRASVDSSGSHSSNRLEATTRREETSFPAVRPASNLTVLLNQHDDNNNNNQGQTQAAADKHHRRQQQHRQSSRTNNHVGLDEADSASGPAMREIEAPLCSSAPLVHPSARSRREYEASRRRSDGVPPEIAGRTELATAVSTNALSAAPGMNVRRCLSSRELGTLAPPSGSPYQYLLTKKTELEESTRKRLQSLRVTKPLANNSHEALVDDGSSNSSSYHRHEGANKLRQRRRAEHTKAVVGDLCEVVADLFVAESKLLKPMLYGVSEDFALPKNQTQQRDRMVNHIQAFLSALPTRYALSADTPSEVLLHMRLMSAARSDSLKAAVHIHNLEDDEQWKNRLRPGKLLRLVTIACSDATGLLELITKNLATSGSRVLDADVMLSADGIVLDRFVVEMSGRLLLDKLANLVENFLRDAQPAEAEAASSSATSSSASPGGGVAGSLYHRHTLQGGAKTPANVQEEMQAAVPLLEVLSTSNSAHLLSTSFPRLRRGHSMPDRSVVSSSRQSFQNGTPDGVTIPSVSTSYQGSPPTHTSPSSTQRRGDRHVLENRRTVANLDNFGTEGGGSTAPLDYVTVHGNDETRDIPLIPFEEIMLIETIASGRVSTIYRAAWQETQLSDSRAEGPFPISPVKMVALKVATVDSATNDFSNVDEVRREADIAARLKHPNICGLEGVAADTGCFCLAYELCEGGSLLSLLGDQTRFYEYLPIALDIANGMAYLHSRDVIHRDLKPSNILLTRDHRAKIADFGLSVTNTGQELTAETGTYRYMAPEVIRHQSYSSNADVYSFGICLWQLITREAPFASMTPIQAAYAVAEGRRPQIPPSTPRRLQEIITACWDQDSYRRPSFTYVAMALADYAKMAFSPANVGALTLQIANEMLSNVEGNSTVNVDFSTPVASGPAPQSSYLGTSLSSINSSNLDDIGLQI